jgi:hypothetical protein
VLSIALIGPSWKRTLPSESAFLISINESTDVKMWHVGVHIVDVPSWEIEPDYDEYYSV